MFLFEDHYTIAVWSRAKLSEDIVYEILKCLSVRRLVFPALLPVAPKKELRLETPEEFDLALVPKVFRASKKAPFLMVPLQGENGFELTLCIEKVVKVVPHSFDLAMPLQAVQAGAVNWREIKEVFLEVVPILQSDAGHVLYHGPNQDERIAYGDPKGYQADITLEWFSYYGPQALDVLGRERFDGLRTCYEKIPLNDGILIVLQEAPLDMTNPEHVARKRQAEHELGFDELAKDEKRVWRHKPIKVPEEGKE